MENGSSGGIAGKITFLGTGTSSGVPHIGCSCKVCSSGDPRDRRMRCSALVETGGARILVDCSPDFYFQMLAVPFRRIDGVLITHEHYDHVGGLDDLRPFCVFGAADIYSDSTTLRHIRARIPYCFKERLYKGVPRLRLREVKPHEEFRIGGAAIVPLRVMHGKMEILGYRIGGMAYITDMTSMEAPEMRYLAGIRLLVVNALRHTPHPTHQTVGQAAAFARNAGSPLTYLTHMSHGIGLHGEEEPRLPDKVHLAYDGLTLLF